ncbi:MAG: haloalkane dehalogenase [Deltaproteobacteria bacterium]|nr:MAG: haloalkane dehalogenase [Deltaproteobacteria bacterium]
MPVIRTPEERFSNLPDFPYKPHYVEINGLRVHYIDEGLGDPVLCLHGEPTWSFLYRKMVPILTSEHRMVAPDFVGFGRSDKYTEAEEYTYEMHRDTLFKFIKTLGLERITVVVQDWGGLIGLRVAGMVPERFARLVIMNTGLPTGDENIPEAFLNWRNFVERTPDLPVGMIVQGATVQGDKIHKDVVAAYEAPFPDATYKAGARAWPLMVPIKPDDPASAELRLARQAMTKWDKPALVMFSDMDPITRGGDLFFRALIPTAQDQPEIVIRDAGHFLQEDKGAEIAGQILEFINRSTQ